MTKLLSKVDNSGGAQAFDTRRRNREGKAMAVLNIAADLFLTHGYNRTRMDDVAETLGITKPALYNYFSSKQEVLYGCHMLGHDIIDDACVKIEAEGGSGLSKLKRLIQVYAEIMTHKFGMCLVQLDEHELTIKARAKVTRRKRSVHARFVKYLEQGAEDGSLRRCDARLTAFWIAGALNSNGRWFRADGRMTREDLGKFLAEELTRGLLPDV